MSDSTSSLTLLTNIFTSPQQAFQDLREDYPVLLPLLTLILVNAALVLLLFTFIDFQWYVDHMVEMQAGDLSLAEQKGVRSAFEMMSPNTMGAIGAGTVAIFLPIVFSLQAAYFVIVSNINNDGFEFKQWFSFISWCSLPSLMGALASLVVIFTSSNGQFAPETLNPLSLNALFFNLNAVKGLGAVLASIDLSVFWTMTLMTIGYSKWTNKSVPVSFFIILVPYILFYGIRFLMV